MGAFIWGGRWNSEGVHMLYTSENSSLAYIESLVHFDEGSTPPDLYIIKIALEIAGSLIYEVPDKEYPRDWQLLDNLGNKAIGGKWMSERKYLAIKIRSAVNRSEYNYLLNPLFPGYHDRVSIASVEKQKIDSRLIKH